MQHISDYNALFVKCVFFYEKSGRVSNVGRYHIMTLKASAFSIGKEKK